MYNVTCIDGRTPSRGWYSIFPFVLSEKINENELKWCLKDDEDLVLARINIHEYRDRDIDEHALDNLKGIFNFFRRYNKEIILRFVYDVDGNGLLNEPESIDIIMNHIKQVAPCIAENHDIILTMQGLFIGSWGEMHTSRYANTRDMVRLTARLHDAVQGKVDIAVRKPSQLRDITEGLKKISYKRTKQFADNAGLYDDAILATESDMGTFTENIRDDILNVDGIHKIKLTGGEAVSDNKLNDGEAAVSGMRLRGVTYLNSQYDSAVLDKWKGQFLGSCGMSVYEYMTRYLGYRLEYQGIRKPLFGNDAVISIKNTGFASFYGKLVLNINDIYISESRSDILLPGESAVFSIKKSQIPRNLTLSCMRVSDGKSIGLNMC